MSRINATGPAQRNKQPIFERLTPLLQHADRVLEVGAGDGTHARHALTCLPDTNWQSTEHPLRMDVLEQGLAGCRGLGAPAALDVTGAWPAGPFAAVYAANVAHIMSWQAVEALFAGSARVLEPGGLLCLYGPFFDDSGDTAPSNLAFDRRLRCQDQRMGIRRVQALDQLAQDGGLDRHRDWPMPANNRLLVWQRRHHAGSGTRDSGLG